MQSYEAIRFMNETIIHHIPKHISKKKKSLALTSFNEGIISNDNVGEAAAAEA